MTDSLSRRLNLRINGYPICLNEKLNVQELSRYNIKKGGFFQRLIIKPSRNEVLFWSKNCELKYFNEDFPNTISPILNVKAGANIMFGTSAYLWYKKTLLKFVFQIIHNELAAKYSLEKFEEKLIEFIGKPSSTDTIFKIWEIENQKLIIEFPHNTQHGYIYLMFNR